MDPSLTPIEPEVPKPKPASKGIPPAPKRPVPISPQPTAAPSPKSGADMLPPETPDVKIGDANPPGARWFRRVAIIGALALVVLGGAFVANTPPADEYKYPDYAAVQTLDAAKGPVTNDSRIDLAFVQKGAALASMDIVSNVVLDEDSRPEAAAVVAAAKKYDLDPTPANEQAFSAALKNAQVLPQPAVNVGLLERRKVAPIPQDVRARPPLSVQPSETREMARNIAQGQTKMFQVLLFDNEAQDGDIVELVVNGKDFAQVPLTNTGATLSVPLSSRSATSISLRGVHDGGGGITVSLVSSAGTYHTQSLTEGTLVHVGVVSSAAGPAR